MLPAKPCLPTSAPSPPAGPEWLHEIKHDGYRMLAHRDGARVRLISRRGLDWGWRFPTIIAAVKALAVRSRIIGRRADRGAQNRTGAAPDRMPAARARFVDVVVAVED